MDLVLTDFKNITLLLLYEIEHSIVIFKYTPCKFSVCLSEYLSILWTNQCSIYPLTYLHIEGPNICLFFI